MHYQFCYNYRQILRRLKILNLKRRKDTADVDDAIDAIEVDTNFLKIFKFLYSLFMENVIIT